MIQRISAKVSVQLTPVGNTDPFTPTPERPVRVRARTMPTDTHFEPHHHAWAQLAYCASGILQVTVAAPRHGGAHPTR